MKDKVEMIYIVLDGRFTNDKDGKQKEFPMQDLPAKAASLQNGKT
jgi:hypothetical protein